MFSLARSVRLVYQISISFIPVPVPSIANAQLPPLTTSAVRLEVVEVEVLVEVEVV